MADDAKKRFESYGWKVFEVDGHDYTAIDRVLARAKKVAGQPSIVIASTHIGCGAPTKHDTPDSHGAPLGAEELAATKKALGLDPEKSFYVPEEVYSVFKFRTIQQHRFAKKTAKGAGEIAPAPTRKDLLRALPAFDPAKTYATRGACGTIMNALAQVFPGLVGGSADLAPSNKTYLKGLGDVAPGEFAGRNYHFGIRELAMAAIVNGITAFDGTLRGYGATFFVFSDYCKPAIRLAALMELPSIFVFSHDSYCVGEDGPTHEPVEQLASLRSMPNVRTWRPADANETAYAWVEMLMRTDGPSCILTTRQNLPILEGVTPEGVEKGGYVVYQSGKQDSETILFIATGSEVSICVEAAKRLAAEGRGVRVASFPCIERFYLETTPEYRCSVMPQEMKRRVIVEAGVRYGLDRFRLDFRTTAFVTLDHFGASAPYQTLSVKFGFTPENVYNVAKTIA